MIPWDIVAVGFTIGFIFSFYWHCKYRDLSDSVTCLKGMIVNGDARMENICKRIRFLENRCKGYDEALMQVKDADETMKDVERLVEEV